MPDIGQSLTWKLQCPMQILPIPDSHDRHALFLTCFFFSNGNIFLLTWLITGYLLQYDTFTLSALTYILLVFCASNVSYHSYKEF